MTRQASNPPGLLAKEQAGRVLTYARKAQHKRKQRAAHPLRGRGALRRVSSGRRRCCCQLCVRPGKLFPQAGQPLLGRCHVQASHLRG